MWGTTGEGFEGCGIVMVGIWLSDLSNTLLESTLSVILLLSLILLLPVLLLLLVVVVVLKISFLRF
jgi:hypothetical protein